MGFSMGCILWPYESNYKSPDVGSMSFLGLPSMWIVAHIKVGAGPSHFCVNGFFASSPSISIDPRPRGSRYSAILELGLQSHVWYGFWYLIPQWYDIWTLWEEVQAEPELQSGHEPYTPVKLKPEPEIASFRSKLCI